MIEQRLNPPAVPAAHVREPLLHNPRDVVASGRPEDRVSKPCPLGPKVRPEFSRLGIALVLR